jgi:formylglycine-generating enzyme required for sulfatase activity
MGRHALLIGVSEFTDPRLSRLNAPINDVARLKGILEDAARGGFDSVDLLPNKDFLDTRDRLSRFYHQRAPDDMLLLYYSGHGILGRGNRLYLATVGSNLDLPRDRSIAAQEVRDFIAECRAERQIVVLDCCHSGAFADRPKGGPSPPAVTPETFSVEGTGLYVLTASDALQFAWDAAELRLGDEASGQLSQFTSWLVEGLEGGQAAPGDEHITMDAIYRYLTQRAKGSATTPQRFVHGGVGDLVISANPLAGASQIDPDIVAALEADHFRMRLGAVTELASLIGEMGAAARGARRLLERHLQLERDFAVRQAIGKVLQPAEPHAPGTRPTPIHPQEPEESAAQPVAAAVADLAGFRDAAFAPELVVIPAGEFSMGSPDGEDGRFDDEGPRHRVTIGRRFAIGRYPVTFEEYDRFCEATRREKPSDQGWGRGRRPVINVGREDVQAYLGWLSRETGQAYRLPSEAEWEYACRAGTTKRYSFGDSITPQDANYGESKLGRTSEVGAYQANPWGLHDMHGNVWEWVEDDWHDDYRGAPNDGSAWKEAESDSANRRFVVRGGSWVNVPRDCRSAYRVRYDAGDRGLLLGFRVARTAV